MASVLSKLKLLPYVAYYRLTGRGARDYAGQWQDYWSSIEQTGEGGQVLWDTPDMSDMHEFLDRTAPHMDRSLPLIDLGCGNGTRSRFLAEHFERVVGFDISPAAIELARSAPQNPANVEFRVMDITAPELGPALGQELGDANIYMRGVYHVIQHADRSRVAANLEQLVGARGVLYQIETGSRFFDYMLEHPDATKTGLPRLMQRVIEHGIVPAGFEAADQARWFPAERWEVLDARETSIHTLELADGSAGRAPAYALVARLRPG